jgi:hypothetical protein
MNRPSNFADRPSGRKFRLQLGPWRHGRRWELNFGEGKAQLGQERVGECSGAHLRPIPGVGRLRGRAGEGARRHQPPVAAVSLPPAKLWRGRANTRHWRLQWVLVKAARVSHGCGKEQEGELAVEAQMADRDEQPVLGTAGDFYSRPAPRLACRTKSSTLLRSTATCLGLHACKRTDDGPLGSVRRRYDVTRTPRRWAHVPI